MSDLIRSLLVIIIPLVIITAVFTNIPRDHPVKTVDWTPVLTTARSRAPFPVLAPTNLPDSWRVTKASWVKRGDPDVGGQVSPRNQWEFGVLTPDDTYIGLGQGDLELKDFVAQQSRQGTADGTSSVGGQSWDRLVSPDGRTRSLVWTAAKVTTVVSGDLPYPALETFASTLASD
jgi:hypothetical protein